MPIGGILNTIGTTVGEAAPAIQGATAGAGLLGNVLNMIQRGQQTDKLKQFENMTPEQLSGLVSRGTAPLSQALRNTVGNQVQADVASRGLAESPGIFAQAESQALAPYEQSNQQVALQLLLQKMGLPAQVIASLGGQTDLTKVLQMLQGRATPSQNPNPNPTDGSPTLQQYLSLFNNNSNSSGLTAPNNFTGDTTPPPTTAGVDA